MASTWKDSTATSNLPNLATTHEFGSLLLEPSDPQLKHRFWSNLDRRGITWTHGQLLQFAGLG